MRRTEAHPGRPGAEPGSSFTPIPGVDLGEILCVQEDAKKRRLDPLGGEPRGNVDKAIRLPHIPTT
jgi:hypothetical protein